MSWYSTKKRNMKKIDKKKEIIIQKPYQVTVIKVFAESIIVKKNRMI